MFASLHTSALALDSVRPGRGPLPLIRRLARMMAVQRQRRALAALDDTRLSDIGLTRAEAAAEAGRFAWDLRTISRA
ncbi:MAG: DUF1127 domain-containing protein [Gemmobacter sp.]|nr:DUF1127 domain-containing protein [Gemmobacter sp.]